MSSVRYLLDVVLPGSQEVKSYSYTTWEQRSFAIRQLPKGCQIKAYERGRKHARLTDQQIQEIREEK